MNSRGILTICLALVCAGAIPAQATTITVINTNDSGPGSLRQALAVVNDGDTINFDSSLNGQTITLTTAALFINKSVIVMGPGANLLTVARAQNAPEFRIFHVTSGHTVTIQGLTITNGSTFDGFGGAGIYNDHSNLTVNNCVITANAVDHRTDGGGITNNGELSGSASLTLNDSTISGNSVAPGGTATVGGGIYNYAIGGSGTVTINNSTISNNQAFQGGGIFNFGGVPNSVAVVTINNSTVSGNFADQYSGGIVNLGDEGGQATLTVANCTFSGNSLSCCDGGAIFNDGNNQPGGATSEIGNTIFKGSVPNQRNILNQGGVVISDGYNLTNDAGVLNTNGGIGGFNAPGDQINTEPLLGPLQGNGGPTFTHALLPGSPAIDAGDPNFTPPPFFDQRGPGFDRVVNGRIDKGSFEVQGPTPTPTATATPTATPTSTSTATPTATATSTPTATATTTPTPTSSGTATPTPTATATSTPTATATATPTSTQIATATPTPTPTPTSTATPASTSTPTPTPTPRATPTPRGSPAPRPRPTPAPRPIADRVK